MKDLEWQFIGKPETYHDDVLCWCSSDGMTWHKRVMYLVEDGNWSENYEVMCWIDIPNPD